MVKAVWKLTAWAINQPANSTRRDIRVSDSSGRLSHQKTAQAFGVAPRITYVAATQHADRDTLRAFVWRLSGWSLCRTRLPGRSASIISRRYVIH